MRLPATATAAGRIGGSALPGTVPAVAKRAAWALRHVLGLAACLFALTVVWHTLAFLALHRPALPLYDGWAPWTDLDAVLRGRTTPLRVLVGRHNEHRVLLARLLFLVDLLDGGEDRVGIAASLAAQAAQAALWLVLLRRDGIERPTRWLVGGAVVAMLFTLRQGDNFVSGFQAQFTGVFALNVATAFVLLPRLLEDGRTDGPCPLRALAGLVGLLLLPFTMANGLLAGPTCALTALSIRTPGGRRVACLAMAATALSVILDLSLPAENAQPSTFAVTPRATLHAAAYLGGMVTSGRVPWAVAAGLAGLAAVAVMVAGAVRTGLSSRAETIAFETVLFTLASAGATAAGRIGAGFGVDQALSGRYATGSAAFWSATLVFWAARLARLPPGEHRRHGTVALSVVAVLLLGFVARDEHSYDRTLARQSAAAERALAAFDHGGEADPADLAVIGVDAGTARTDMALLRRVRAFADPSARPAARD